MYSLCKAHVNIGACLLKTIDKNSGIPIYIQIKDEIIKFVRSCDSTRAIPHHEELARIFGTSRVTVAKAISELKKEKILSAVKGRGTFFTGTVPLAEKHKMLEKRNLITFVTPCDEVSPIFLGCQHEAEKAGFQILLKNDALGENKTREAFLKRERDFLLKYRDGEFGDSLILYYEGGRDNLDILKSLIKEKRPIVFIDRTPDELDVDSVVYDNFNAARMVTEEFIKMGRKNIAIIGTGKCISSAREQVAGYRKALEENGLEVRKENIIFEVDFYYYFRTAEIERIKKRFDRIRDKVDAIYFMSVLPEYLVMEHIKSSGLKPDILLAGDESSTVGRLQSQYVFRVRKPTMQLGKEAVKLLNSKFLPGYSGKAAQIRLPVKLIRF